jgi:hypothetical protein
MTGVFSAGRLTGRRQADALERALSGQPDAGSLSPRESAALAPLLDVVAELRAVPAPTPRPEFVADLRRRLLAEADTVLVPIDTATEARLRLAPADPAVRRRERRLATLLGSAALVGATASVAVAAQGALPGETLYPVKRAIENVRTDVTTDDVSRAELLLAGASGRLQEIDELTRDGSAADVAALPGTLDTFTRQSAEAGGLLLDDYRLTGRESSVSRLRDFTGESMTSLSRLEATLPDAARDELLVAASTLATLDERAGALCPTCGGSGVAEVPTVLASAGTTGAVTVPASLPGVALPTVADVGEVVGTDRAPRPPADDRTGRTGDPALVDPPTVSPPALPPTVDVPTPRPPRSEVPTGLPTTVPTTVPSGDADTIDGVAETTTDAIDTITGTLTGTITEGTVGGDVVEGVEDVVDGTVGGLTGGLGGR